MCAFLFSLALYRCFIMVLEKMKTVNCRENQINCLLSLFLSLSLPYLYFIVGKTRTDNCNLCVSSIELDIKRAIILSLSIVIPWEHQRQSQLGPYRFPSVTRFALLQFPETRRPVSNFPSFVCLLILLSLTLSTVQTISVPDFLSNKLDKTVQDVYVRRVFYLLFFR